MIYRMNENKTSMNKYVDIVLNICQNLLYTTTSSMSQLGKISAHL